MQNLDSLLFKEKISGIKNGIYLTDISLEKGQTKVSKNAWEKIYNFDIKQLLNDRKDYFKNKLEDHINIINKYKIFSQETNYLEIGCGPAYVGEYLMKKYDANFIGIDFNFNILKILKQYFDNKGYKKYLLIHADINEIPLKNNTIDFIYGGGVIEHFADTSKILKESFRVLKNNGVFFNTVPSFNFSWPLLRFNNNIPSVFVLKQIFEYIHIKILKNRILEKNFGYELSFTQNKLKALYKAVGFNEISTGTLAFHPSQKKIKNQFLSNFYFLLSKFHYFSPIYFVSAVKKV